MDRNDLGHLILLCRDLLDRNSHCKESSQKILLMEFEMEVINLDFFAFGYDALHSRGEKARKYSEFLSHELDKVEFSRDDFMSRDTDGQIEIATTISGQLGAILSALRTHPGEGVNVRPESAL